MGGSGSGGSFSSEDMIRLNQAAEKRLKALAERSTKVLFVCENDDRTSLDSHIARSQVFEPDRIIVHDGSDAAAAKAAVGDATIVVLFTNSATSTTFLDSIVDHALLHSRQGMHVRAAAESRIPAKVTAYRWPTMSWQELEEVFS